MKATKYVVFGWTIHKNVLIDGEEISASFAKDTPMDTMSNWFFWTEGARVLTAYPENFNDDFVTQQRGRFSTKTTFAGHTYKKGAYVYKAVGDTEFWCFDYLLNDKSAPDFEFVLLSAGQTYATSAGQLILIASGDTNFGAAPKILEVVSENKIITTNSDVSLIIFSRSK